MAGPAFSRRPSATSLRLFASLLLSPSGGPRSVVYVQGRHGAKKGIKLPFKATVRKGGAT